MGYTFQVVQWSSKPATSFSQPLPLSSTQGIYVDRIIQGSGYERFIEWLTLSEDTGRLTHKGP